MTTNVEIYKATIVMYDLRRDDITGRIMPFFYDKEEKTIVTNYNYYIDFETTEEYTFVSSDVKPEPNKKFIMSLEQIHTDLKTYTKALALFNNFLDTRNTKILQFKPNKKRD